MKRFNGWLMGCICLAGGALAETPIGMQVFTPTAYSYNAPENRESIVTLQGLAGRQADIHITLDQTAGPGDAVFSQLCDFGSRYGYSHLREGAAEGRALIPFYVGELSEATEAMLWEALSVEAAAEVVDCAMDFAVLEVARDDVELVRAGGGTSVGTSFAIKGMFQIVMYESRAPGEPQRRFSLHRSR
jgi:hypothetical protein